MGVNGVQSSTYAGYVSETYSNTTSKGTSKKENNTEVAATYESSAKKMTDSERASLVKKLKADTENRVSQLKSLVQDMFAKQGLKVQSADDMWKMLASGNFTVDAETAAKAKEEISENGYWGVNQTSQRIFDMAVALSGGDSERMEKMLDAFKKGFGEATKTWGKTLPDICQKTYDAVLEKFENYNVEMAE